MCKKIGHHKEPRLSTHEIMLPYTNCEVTWHIMHVRTLRGLNDGRDEKDNCCRCRPLGSCKYLNMSDPTDHIPSGL